jgi:uncharacterized protein YndB with AHSA1/START domain
MPAAVKVATPNDREIVVRRAFDAPRALVFAAHTEPALVKRWLLGPPGWTMPVCEIDLRVGGRFRYVWAHPQQASFEISGVYREIAAPERIVHTELFNGGEALTTTRFAERNGRTTLTFSMRFPSQAARDAALATGMTDGMEQSYQRLDALLPGLAPAG